MGGLGAQAAKPNKTRAEIIFREVIQRIPSMISGQPRGYIMLLMKVLPAALSLCFCIAACAHTQPPKETPVATALPSEPPAVSRVTTQVSLPYMFSRRGVEIRVNSVEFANGQLVVSLILKEVRNEKAELLAATLMQARIPKGESLAWVGFNQEGDAVQTDRTIPLTPGEKKPINLVFQLPETAMAPGSPIELQFPTGKWWSSKQPSAQ
jgi:hypothetical protein